MVIQRKSWCVGSRPQNDLQLISSESEFPPCMSYNATTMASECQGTTLWLPMSRKYRGINWISSRLLEFPVQCFCSASRKIHNIAHAHIRSVPKLESQPCGWMEKNTVRTSIRWVCRVCYYHAAIRRLIRIPIPVLWKGSWFQCTVAEVPINLRRGAGVHDLGDEVSRVNWGRWKFPRSIPYIIWKGLNWQINRKIASRLKSVDHVHPFSGNPSHG